MLVKKCRIFLIPVSCIMLLVGLYEIYRSGRELLDEIMQHSLHLAISLGVFLLGVLLLVSCVATLLYENYRNARELKRLQERQEVLEQIKERTQALAHHQRLETIGTLTASISHEFNNLLTPIMSYSLLTLEKLPPEEEELYDNILEIYNASQKAKVIISRLSDLSRKNAPRHFHTGCVDDQVRKALEIAMPAMPEQVTVKLNLNCLDIPIRANEIQLCQMFLNLMLNAFQAMENGGTLEIDTTFDDDMVHVYLQDTGIGIPAQIRDKVFAPFFTTKESGRGTGLGLAIVAQVVEDHNGYVGFDDVPGGGTRFHVALPRQKDI